MKNFKSFIFVTAFFISAAFFWFSIFPIIQETNSLRASKNKLSEQVLNLKAKEQEIQQAVKFFDTISDDQKRLMELAVPSVPNRAALAAHISKISFDSGMAVRNVVVSESKQLATQDSFGQETLNQTADLTTYKVDLSLEGSDYRFLAPLLISIEDSLRIFDVKTFSVKKEINEGREKYVFSVEGDAYSTTSK